MSAKPVTNPRKRAGQARSRATVEALVEATARILVRDGFDKASTNRIAREAGVSIGSLYQYYPSKEALVAAVAERHAQDLMAVVRAALASVEAQPIDQGVRALVAAAIAAHRVDPALHRVLAEQTPHIGAIQDVGAFNRETAGLFRAYLERHGEELRALDLDMAAFVCVTAIEALTHSAVLHRSDLLTEAAAEKLVDEAARLVLRYLQ
jgi:AcrR family transcriptional regulator